MDDPIIVFLYLILLFGRNTLRYRKQPFDLHELQLSNHQLVALVTDLAKLLLKLELFQIFQHKHSSLAQVGVELVQHFFSDRVLNLVPLVPCFAKRTRGCDRCFLLQYQLV